MNALPLDAYLNRIGYDASPEVSLDCLAQLQRHHLEHIAFENLNPFLGLPVPLDSLALADKLVDGGRGGYCFEHNLFFMAILQQIGFEVRGLTGRVYWNQPPGFQPPRSHMLLLVTLPDGDYLVDVGFGGLTPTAPLRFDERGAQPTNLESFRVQEHGDHFSVQVLLGSEWQLLYRFDLTEQWPVDFEMANWYVACHPASKFVNNLIAVRALPDRRYTLLNRQFTLRYADGRSEQQILDDGPLLDVLSKTFAIDLAGLEDPLQQRLAKLLARYEQVILKRNG
ncbi:arylamine N-acetyltransferase family protein [Alcanivorax hongdengensis]|nr:arylamine N-acetyltransferase [Alcanivorax hongdengensis]